MVRERGIKKGPSRHTDNIGVARNAIREIFDDVTERDKKMVEIVRTQM
jgi:hypothetical protein